jgi:hypothetical protein
MATRMKTITVERFLEQRDVDAAIYLLGRMLGLSDDVVGGKRVELESIKTRIEHSRHITPEDRHQVVANYRAVIG